MPGRQAKLLSSITIRRCLRIIARRTTARRDRVIFLLSLRAGLRACEISGLDWRMVTDASGRVGRVLAVEDAIAKKRAGRRIPVAPELRAAITDLGLYQRR